MNMLRAMGKSDGKKIDELKPNHEWATHTLPYSPETKGIYS